MKLEISSTCNFLEHMLRLSDYTIAEEQLSIYNKKLYDILFSFYESIWLPSEPTLYKSKRKLIFYHSIDKKILIAALHAHIPIKELLEIYNKKFILNIDPGLVTVQFNSEQPKVLFCYTNPPNPWMPILDKKCFYTLDSPQFVIDRQFRKATYQTSSKLKYYIIDQIHYMSKIVTE